MKKTKLTDISDFKVGDTIEILNRPKYWHSQLSNNNPFEANLNYPHILTIKKIKNDAISCGNYGWDLASIIIANCNKIEIPETWHVKVTEENREVLFNWRFPNTNNPLCRLNIGDIVGRSIVSERGHNPEYLTEGYGNEISYEDFRKYILKENIKDQPILENYGVIGSSELSAYFKNTSTSLDGEFTDFIYFIRDNKWENEWLSDSRKTLLSLKKYLELVGLTPTEKKIIGYKFKNEEFIEAANNLTSTFSNITMNDKYHFVNGSGAFSKLTSLNVLNIWCDLIYEEEIKLPEINGYEGVIEGNYIKYGCQKVHKSLFDETVCILDTLTVYGKHIDSPTIVQIRKYLEHNKLFNYQK